MLTEQTAGRRWTDLLRDMRRAQEEMNRLFGGIALAARTDFPPLDIWAGTEGAVLVALIPGVSPDVLDITVHQDTVTLRGKREPETTDDDTAVLRQERVYGPFARTAVLPFNVDAENVSAQFSRGVLTLTLPRPASEKPRKVQVART